MQRRAAELAMESGNEEETMGQLLAPAQVVGQVRLASKSTQVD